MLIAASILYESRPGSAPMRKYLPCLFGLLVRDPTAANEPAWRYISEAAADSPLRPVFRFVALAASKPDELREQASYRGKTQKYAQIRYGSDDSRRVVVVVDEVTKDDFDLYVDANR